jgi:OmcA/MtrC family decaheme c-type cytochrome
MCENCHSNLDYHGGNRHDPDYCNTCHMPEALDRNAEQTIHLKYMVHSIHRGEDLDNGFSVGGVDFSDVKYPGDLRNCEFCHDDDNSATHVFSQTAFFGESRGTCHGEGKFASVDKVHAR